MDALTINVVYAHLREESLPGLSVPDTHATVIWSRAETPGADVYLYINSYGFNPRSTCSGGKLRVLFISEPLSVHPAQYRRSTWRHFDYCLALVDSFAHPRFLPVVRPNYGYPYELDYALDRWYEHPAPVVAAAELLRRPRAICLINNNKRSLIPGELYSARREMAAWFHADGRVPFDVYGATPFKLPNYRGRADDKLAVYGRYRFALCFENLYLPHWSSGYLTEKLFDCFFASAVPVYYGCYNIERYVPTECFVDYRRLGSPAALRDHLLQLTDDAYLAHAHAIQRFLRTYDFRRHHWNHVYRLVAQLAQEARVHPEQLAALKRLPLPPDYLQTAPTLEARLRFLVSCFLVSHPGLLRPVLRLTRGRGR